MTEDDRREGTEGKRNNVREESEEATTRGDRVKGGAEEVDHGDGRKTGGVKDNVQDEFDEAQKD